MLQYLEQFRISLSVFKVPAPTIQRNCPYMACTQGGGGGAACSGWHIAKIVTYTPSKLDLEIQNFSICTVVTPDP